MEPCSTPERRPQVEPDTVKKVVVGDGDSAVTETRKRPRGRPPSNKKQRPPPILEFRHAGPPTAEGWGFIRSHHRSNPQESYRDLEARFRVDHSTIQRHITQKALGDATVGPRRGPPETDRTEAIMRVEAHLEANPMATVTEIGKALEMTRATVWNTLRAGGKTAKSRPLVPWSGGDEALWKADRLRFCKKVLQDPPHRNSLLFVDESLFRVTDDRKVQWVGAGQIPKAREAHSWSAGAHVWGCIGIGFRLIVNLSESDASGPRGGVTAEDYIKMLETHFLPPFLRHQRRHPNTKFWFVQDGARIHTTESVFAALKSWGLQIFSRCSASARKDAAVVYWPPHSPDFNPIENSWALTKKGVNKILSGDLSASTAVKEKLWGEIKQRWNSMSNQHVARLIDSFSRRLKRCIELGGAYTGY